MLLPRDALELDPRFTVDAYGLKLSRLLFASLVTIDSQSLAVVPDLAEQVEIADAGDVPRAATAGAALQRRVGARCR